MTDDGTSAIGHKSFQLTHFVEQDELLGARWWHEGMATTQDKALTLSRRGALMLFAGIVGLPASCVVIELASSDSEITEDALALQQREGWDVGGGDQILWLEGQLDRDSAGHRDWSKDLATLFLDLQPGDSDLAPYYVPTLFQVFNNPRGAGLARVLQPCVTTDMTETTARAQGLAALFADPKERSQTALVVDLRGRRSVAAAAGLAHAFAPVFLFDNWPHPLGVVPSHEPLAAALYHRPDFLRERARRERGAPPAFIIDRQRLAPYSDASDRFDNRYLARLPSPEGLSRLGIRRVLYVTEIPEATELDDLNDDFVAFKDSGIDVKMIALSDFATLRQQDLPGEATTGTAHYHYGGHTSGHSVFWSSYWPSAATSHGLTPAVPRGPHPISAAPRYSPITRPTLFSGRSVGGLSGVGKQKPSGFGRVSYRGPSTGSGRSGSFGRTNFGGFG